MDYLSSLPCHGGRGVDSYLHLHRGFHGELSCRFVHLESRITHTWVCSASLVTKVTPSIIKQDELLRGKWLSQIKGYLRERKVYEAEELMRKMQEVGIEPDLASYNALIAAHGKGDQFSKAQEWFSALESEVWLRPDAVTYRSMIGACGRAGELAEALKLYGKMKTCGFQPSHQNFNTLISLHRRVTKDEKTNKQILGLITDMREVGCIPDSSTLDVVLKLYERWGILRELSEATDVLRAAGWYPTRRCYTILLKAYVKGGFLNEALEIFHSLCSMQTEEPSNSKVSVVKDTYIQSNDGNSSTSVYGLEESVCHGLICLCRTASRYEEALQVYDKMRQSGANPSWFTACSVIDICARLNDVSSIKRGEALFFEMRSSDIGKESTDAGAYTVTINMFLKGGLLDKAAEISSLVMEHEGLVPDSALFLAMLRAYSRSGMPSKAVQVYKWMLSIKITWTAPMFNGVIHCCGRALPLEESIKVFLAMVYAKIPLSSTTCNLMMDIFAKAGLLDKAENVFILAKKQGVLDSISYNTMIAAYGRYKEFNKMELALLDMRSAGFNDVVEALNSMVDAYGKAKQLSRMENILERMNRLGCLPDLSTYNILINIYGKEGLIEEVQKIRTTMKEAGIQPDSYTFNTLIYIYGSAGMPNEAMDAFKEMQQLDLAADEVTYNCLISAFEKSGNHLEAARWSLWMTQLGMK
ncbi:hypothetical protein KP509_19G065200 [Ceratopteris richardii]|uniref:Pentatricopeptide repeat-containing protein n=1 Tax=Ceratopteris richardii TaxID=49495 RepID=A0A8T2SMP1_CERRI|nr:hypothetical protein KP509_19G065200 [Ceratopteris richardii]